VTWLTRMAAMALKELKVVLLDKRARITLVLSPVLQLALFGLATTLEVRNVDIGIVNRDAGVAAERVLAGLDGSRNIRALHYYPTVEALGDAIEGREVLAGLVLPPDLSNRVARGGTGEIGVLLDGRRINAAQIVGGYLAEIAARVGAELRPVRAPAQAQLVAVNWYNPNLDYRWFTMPAMITIVTAVLMVSVSAQAVARERELGTYDELMALPLHPVEILVGKTAPAFCVGLFNAVLYALLIPVLYGVPLVGSVALLLVGIFCFSLAVTGIGLSVSTLAQTQQQAFLGGFLVTVPLILLSGYASPIDNMPVWLQHVAAANPLAHMLAICHGTFLKDWPTSLVFNHIWPMLVVAVVTLGTATALFRARSG
jgi:ABC-2 type transport system permease protein